MNNIKQFKCMICGKMFSELSPIHELRCVCLECYPKMIEETFGKEKEVVTIKRLKKIISGR